MESFEWRKNENNKKIKIGEKIAFEICIPFRYSFISVLLQWYTYFNCISARNSITQFHIVGILCNSIENRFNRTTVDNKRFRKVLFFSCIAFSSFDFSSFQSFFSLSLLFHFRVHYSDVCPRVHSQNFNWTDRGRVVEREECEGERTHFFDFMSTRSHISATELNSICFSWLFVSLFFHVSFVRLCAIFKIHTNSEHIFSSTIWNWCARVNAFCITKWKSTSMKKSFIFWIEIIQIAQKLKFISTSIETKPILSAFILHFQKKTGRQPFE